MTQPSWIDLMSIEQKLELVQDLIYKGQLIVFRPHENINPAKPYYSEDLSVVLNGTAVQINIEKEH